MMRVSTNKGGNRQRKIQREARSAVHKQHTQKSNKHQCVGGIVKFRLSEVSAGVGDGLLIASAW